MARYDGGHGYGWDRGFGRAGRDYASDFYGPSGARGGSAPGGGFRGPTSRGFGRWDAGGQSRGFVGQGYDRGVYGGEYPSGGGYRGDSRRGMYHGGTGGSGMGLDRWAFRQWSGGQRGYPGDYGMGPRSGYAADFQAGSRYDAYARAPFVPEEAYRGHPELDREPGHHRGGWPGSGPGFDGDGVDLDDDEVEQAVRESLHRDSWIRPEQIQVAADGGVVTLTGEVDDYMQARYAWDDAWETEGVRGVINHLTVRTDLPHESHGDVVQQTTGKKKK